jgi:hypothetical protein
VRYLSLAEVLTLHHFVIDRTGGAESVLDVKVS